MDTSVFHIEFEADVHDGRQVTVATITELPGIIAYGQDREEALRQVLALFSDFLDRIGLEGDLGAVTSATDAEGGWELSPSKWSLAEEREPAEESELDSVVAA